MNTPYVKKSSNNPLIIGVILAALFAMIAGTVLSHAAETTTSSFDGHWDATLACPRSPDGARAFSFEFPADVKDGVLHGERGTAQKPGWMQLDGNVKADGSAALVAEGITNLPEYALHHVDQGTPYKHAVTAQFDGSHGTGQWITLRTCNFTFDKK